MNNKELKAHYDNVIAEINKNPALLKDKFWRLENLYVINTKADGKRIFKLTRAQRHFLENLKPRNIILKSRQLGFSTLITIWMLDETLFTPNKDALAIAHVKEGMVDIFDKKAKFAILNFPDAIKNSFNFKTNSKTRLQIQFSDDSVSSFGVSLSGRSGTYQYVHVSEYAKLSKMFPHRAEEIITGTFPAVPLDGAIFIESTAEGANGHFYDMYQEAIKSKAKGVDSIFRVQFYPHFYNWTWDDMEMERFKEIIPVNQMEPNNDINWAEYQKLHNLSDKEISYYYLRWLSLNRDINRLHQEYPTTEDEAFISTGKPYFDQRKVFENRARALEPTYYDNYDGSIRESYNGPLMVYTKPESKKRYVIGADTAEGLHHGDYSTMTIVDVDSKEVVAIYHNHITPDLFKNDLKAVGKYYNNALLAVEVNKDGLWVNNELERDGYMNLYYRQKIDDVTKQVSKMFGWRTDRATRDAMLTELRTIFSEIDILVDPILEEMTTFVRNERGKPEATLGKHDDLIISTAIAYMVRKLWYIESNFSQMTNDVPKSRMDLIFMNLT